MLTHVCCVYTFACTQAAARCTEHANERHSESNETYRVSVAAQTYAAMLIKCCEVEDFKAKQRSQRAGGPWDSKKSAEMRPACGRAIYTKGKEAAAMASASTTR